MKAPNKTHFFQRQPPTLLLPQMGNGMGSSTPKWGQEKYQGAPKHPPWSLLSCVTIGGYGHQHQRQFRAWLPGQRWHRPDGRHSSVKGTLRTTNGSVDKAEWVQLLTLALWLRGWCRRRRWSETHIQRRGWSAQTSLRRSTRKDQCLEWDLEQKVWNEENKGRQKKS